MSLGNIRINENPRNYETQENHKNSESVDYYSKCDHCPKYNKSFVTLGSCGYVKKMGKAIWRDSPAK